MDAAEGTVLAGREVRLRDGQSRTPGGLRPEGEPSWNVPGKPAKGEWFQPVP